MKRYIFYWLFIFHLYKGEAAIDCSGRCACCTDGKCGTKTGLVGDTNCLKGCVDTIYGHKCLNPCRGNCLRCSQDTGDQCLTCKPGFYGKKTDCVDSCPILCINDTCEDNGICTCIQNFEVGKPATHVQLIMREVHVIVAYLVNMAHDVSKTVKAQIAAVEIHIHVSHAFLVSMVLPAIHHVLKVALITYVQEMETVLVSSISLEQNVTYVQLIMKERLVIFAYKGNMAIFVNIHVTIAIAVVVNSLAVIRAKLDIMK
ncbi:hypothetical protein MAR_032256 [Mya arenaria]|uniref:Uncharacterized protein n=1 Tax=Mya arenaria TaxID=6604 RepID=A0ABY7F650_MYAAR|nr:hypothetical protein MAR_032256 [Mya arenaria]